MLRRLIPSPIRKRVGFFIRQRKCRRASAPRIAQFAQPGRKILYALVPPPTLSNIGDHGQVVAIRRWLAKNFPDMPVLEIDKHEALYCVEDVRRVIGPGDLIVLHSGGNMGDRGIWSETGRRNIISAFHDVPIVSLPQTIFFSDTPEGRKQQAISQRIYGEHPRLTVIGRDRESGELAGKLFKSATTFAMPDFVLSMDYQPPPPHATAKDPSTRRTLLCLRRDNEGVLTDADKRQLQRNIAGNCELYDTTFDEPIPAAQREAMLLKTLEYFASFDAIVTDRYHGLIFAVLCRRPTVVLRTVDHKLVSAFDWFEGIDGLRFSGALEAVPALVDELAAAPFGEVLDWNEEYFDPLAERVRKLLKE